MTEHLSEQEILAAIPGLTADRLSAFVEAEVIVPIHRMAGESRTLVFRRVDLARLHLLCDLTDDLELDMAALGLVLGLIDQLHAARRDLRALARALEGEPPEIRARIGAVLTRAG